MGSKQLETEHTRVRAADRSQRDRRANRATGLRGVFRGRPLCRATGQSRGKCIPARMDACRLERPDESDGLVCNP